MKEKILTENAPAPVGAYNQAVRAGGMIFISGQIPLTPEGTMISGSIEEQTGRCLKNLEAILQAEKLDRGHIVKVTIFLTDMSNFGKVNGVYEEFFSNTVYPARAVVGVKELPKGCSIEMEAIAVED